jgi:undecaprenyl-diphosphatase
LRAEPGTQPATSAHVGVATGQSLDDQVERVTTEVARRPVYRGALIVGLLAVFAFVSVGLLVSTGISTSVDNAVLDGLQRLAGPSGIALAFVASMLGSEAIFVMLPLTAIVLWLRRLRWQALEVVVATVGAQAVNDGLKLFFHRPRPSGLVVASNLPGQAYSFPSGHAMVSIAFYGVLAYVGWRLLRGRTRGVWMAFMASLVLLVGIARLILEMHYPTDVLASWAAGLVWLDVTLVSIGYMHQKRSERGRAAVPGPVLAVDEGAKAGP